MKHLMGLNAACLALILLAITGCEKSHTTGPTEPAKVEATHDHDDNHDHEGEHVHGNGPNGGVVFDLGKQHAEFTVDHVKQQCTVLVLGDDEKTPQPVAATELIVALKETRTEAGAIVPATSITLSPQEPVGGKASKFVGADPVIGNVADFAGAVIGEIDGKPAQGEFKE